MPRKVSDAPIVTATNSTTFTPVTHQGQDGRVSLDIATVASAGLMSSTAMAQLATLVASLGLGQWRLSAAVRTAGVSLAIVDQAGNAVFAVQDDGEVLGLDMFAPAPITHEVLRWYHEPYIDPSESVYLTWHSTSEDATLAQIRLEGGTNWITVQSVRTREFPFRNGEYIHTAICLGLSPASIYDVRWPNAVRQDRLRTCPRDTQLKCLMASDHQRPNSIRNEDLEMIAFGSVVTDLEVDLMLMPGDFVNDDGVQSTLKSRQWCDFIEVLSDAYRTVGGAQMPWIALLGNHEMTMPSGDSGGDGVVAYMDILFSHGYDPADPTRFARSAMTTKVGNFFYLVSLETDFTVPLPGAQTDWFEDVMDDCPNYTHAMVMGHAPAYYFSTPLAGRDAVTTQSRHIRNHMWPTMVAQGNVRCYGAGHTHILSVTQRLRTHYDPQLSQSDNDLRWTVDPTGVRQLGCGPWQADPRNMPDVFPVSSIDGSEYVQAAVSVSGYSLADRLGTVKQRGSGLTNVPDNNNFHVWELVLTDTQFIGRALNRDGETMFTVEETI